jgi:hypothetical protein
VLGLFSQTHLSTRMLMKLTFLKTQNQRDFCKRLI